MAGGRAEKINFMRASSLERDTLQALESRLPDLRRQWSRSQPFHWAVIEDFLPLEHAERVYEAYPQPDDDRWDHTTYMHQKGKYTKTQGFEGVLADFFDFSASPSLLAWLEKLTGIESLISDPSLAGGGLHSSSTGGFLDIHIDYNRHPKFKWHRRLNLILYMNKDWKPEYNGQLELWDLRGRKKQKLEEVFPHFNTAVIFETNGISYHGHPHRVNCPASMNRQSLALYYYTEGRDDDWADADEHNTIYRQTNGISGYLKTSASAMSAGVERINDVGIGATARHVLHRLTRGIMGKPPENR